METELRSEGLLSRIVWYSISVHFTIGRWELDKVSGEGVPKTSEWTPMIQWGHRAKRTVKNILT